MKPQISIVIPVRDRANLLKETLDSFLQQKDFTDFEVIIVDDNSTDDPASVVKEIKDARFNLIKLPDKFGRGKACARNFGNMLSQGEIIAVCDSDDMARPNRLKVTYEFFKKYPKVGVFYSDGDVKDEIAGITRERKLKWSEFDLQRLLRENYVAHSSLAYRKEIAVSFPYNPFFIYAEDYELVLRLAKNKIGFASSSEKLFVQRVHEARESKNRELQDKFAQLAREIHFGQKRGIGIIEELKKHFE